MIAEPHKTCGRCDERGVKHVKVPFRKLYRIGEIMRYTGLSRQTFDRLARIAELKGQGKTLREIREILEADRAGSREARS
jgi:hypothetical protein